MARIKKTLIGNLQDKIIQVWSPSLLIFLDSVCQSIATHMFVYFVRTHVCLSVSVDVTFHFKLGFGRDLGLCLYLDFEGLVFESVS